MRAKRTQGKDPHRVGSLLLDFVADPRTYSFSVGQVGMLPLAIAFMACRAGEEAHPQQAAQLNLRSS